MAKSKATTSTALVNWDKELADAAAAAKGTAAAASGGANRISIQGGTLTLDGNEVPHNQLVCVIADFVMENKFYTTEFDPDNPSSPDCYAFGRKLDELGPHDDAEDKQNETCAGCKNNEWGSSDKGRGKACRNTYKLLLVPAGRLDDRGMFEAPEDDEDMKGELYSLSIPPTSLKAFSAYVDTLSGRLRPPWAVFTKVSVKGDKKNQVAVSFQAVGDVPPEFLQTAKDRNKEAARTIETPYPKNSEREEKPVAKGKGKRRF